MVRRRRRRTHRVLEAEERRRLGERLYIRMLNDRRVDVVMAPSRYLVARAWPADSRESDEEARQVKVNTNANITTSLDLTCVCSSFS